MRITAPGFACPLTRPFMVAGEHRLGVSVLSAWTLEGAPLSVQELWPRFLRAAGPETILDQGIPKSASEWLLVGHAHAASPVTHLAVSVETMGRQKVLNVVGDRVWRDGVPTPPAPFTKMPLGWTHAFGGEGFAENPIGKGYVTGDPEGAPLPNVEAHGRMIHAPSARPTPAGFGALGPEHPRRTEGLGTYDARWMEHDFPGFARDVDWRVHCVAPDDQRAHDPLLPGQRFVLHNLVEGRPRVELFLPRVMARAFSYADELAPVLREIPLTLRTVWLVPDEDMIVLVATGSERVGSMLASEVKGLLLALDSSDAPRAPEHFDRALAARLDRTEQGLAQMLDDAPLMPEGLRFPSYTAQAEDLSLPERTGALEANAYEGAKRRREDALRLFAEAGFEDGEALFPMPPPPSPPSKEPVGDQIRAALEEAAKQEAIARERMAAMREEAKQELEAAGFASSFLDAGPKAGPPPVLASTQLARLEQIVREARAAGAPMEPFERQLDDPAFHRELIEKERQGREAYRLTAHRVEGAPEEPSFDVRMSVRERVEAAIRDRTSLAEEDLTGADLNELDLSGMDLRGAWLEGAELQRANLSGAQLERAVLAKADLSEAVLRGAVLRYANLGRARLLWTAVEGCDLGEAILAHANLRAASFSRCDLHGADLSEARFGETRFVECDLRGLTLLKMSLAGLSLEACRMSESSLVEVTLDDATFVGCDLSQAAFVTCRGARVRFEGARLENARFVAGCDLTDGDFPGADLRRSALRGATLEGACFDGASLVAADLSDARCARASFVRTDLRQLLATECDLADAILTHANLMNAVLQGADLRGADLSDTNLFAADLALVRADARTSLAGALVTRARHKPLRAKEEVLA